MECWNCLGEGHPSFLCPSAKGAGKAGASPACGICRGKGHDTPNCPSKGGGKHVPKGKGKGGPPNFPGGKGWGKSKGKGGKGFGGKGYGKGKGKISEFDDQGWQHVGASSADWNWAAGTEWAAVEADQGWPPAATWPSQPDAATPPWMAAAQPAQPAWPAAWPGAGGASAPQTPPGLRSMTPAGGFHSLAPAPVKVENRFAALAVSNIVDSNGAAIFRKKIVPLESLIKPKNPSKKRRGRRALSCIGSSAFAVSTASRNISEHISSNSMSANSFESPSSSSSTPCTSLVPSSSSLRTHRRPCCTGQGYQHPDHGHHLTPRSGSRDNLHLIEPHSGICSSDHCNHHTYFYCHTRKSADRVKVEDAQLILDWFLRDSQEGVGGRNGVLGKPSGL